MLRLALGFLLSIPLAAAEGFGWQPGSVQLWRYVQKSTCVQRTAGDELNYQTVQDWLIKLQVDEAQGELQTLTWTILDISAKITGPASLHVFDYQALDTHADPLLGYLAALVDKPLVLQLDRHSGEALQVSGGEQLARAVAQRAATIPGEPSPLAERAAEVYGEAALRRLFSQAFALPQPGSQQRQLPAPLAGTVERTWSGLEWKERAVGEAPAVTWWQHPTPVTAQLASYRAEGRLRRRAQGISMFYGRSSAELRLDALTQPVTLDYRIEWTLGRQLAPEEAAKAGDAAAPAAPPTGDEIPLGWQGDGKLRVHDAGQIEEADDDESEAPSAP